MSKTTKTLDKISSYSFFAGLIASKIQYLPATIITPFLNIASISLYLLGYSVWFLTSHLYPHQPPKFNEWYGFAAFKDQNTYAAALGIAATLTGIAAIMFPVLALPAAWLFFASNSIWSISEYHKLKNPLYGDKNYSESYQKSYLSYALSMTTVSMVGAIATTALYFFPLFFLPIMVVSTLVSVGLIATAMGYWFDFTFNEHKKTPVANPSYETMLSHGSKKSLKLEDTHCPAPIHEKGLFSSYNQHKTNTEYTPAIELVEQSSYSLN